MWGEKRFLDVILALTFTTPRLQEQKRVLMCKMSKKQRSSAQDAGLEELAAQNDGTLLLVRTALSSLLSIV